MRRFVALALCLSLAACGPQPAPVAKGGPVRIMSMNPCIDAILLRVADLGEIASISHYSHDPGATSIPLAQAMRFPANAGTAEEVVATQPSIVLLGAHGDPATQAAIKAAGVEVVSVGVPATVAESLDQVRMIARVAGHPERGEALAREIETALADARPRSGSKAVDALIRQGSGLVPGAGTLADELLDRTGFRNMSADYGLAMWDMLPLEPLIARPPRLLLMDLTEHRDPPGLLAMVPNMRIADFSERLLQCAGPNLIDAAKRLAAIRSSISQTHTVPRRRPGSMPPPEQRGAARSNAARWWTPALAGERSRESGQGGRPS
ncbi:MAG TPA: ABC transporter substrate-binding protein [Sphingobium sp.]